MAVAICFSSATIASHYFIFRLTNSNISHISAYVRCVCVCVCHKTQLWLFMCFFFCILFHSNLLHIFMIRKLTTSVLVELYNSILNYLHGLVYNVRHNISKPNRKSKHLNSKIESMELNGNRLRTVSLYPIWTLGLVALFVCLVALLFFFTTYYYCSIFHLNQRNSTRHPGYCHPHLILHFSMGRVK